MTKKIFISHAVKDKEIADAFVDVILHGALSVPITDIFCVSTDGTKIKSGDDWRKSIKSSILKAKVNFLLITPNYKESEVCMNEMGAAWMTEAKVLPLIVEPINYKTVGVIQEPKQIEKLLDETSLDRVKDVVQEELAIESALIKSDRWTVKKKEFILRVKNHIALHPFEAPMDKAYFKELQQNKIDLEATIGNLIEEKSELENLVSELKKIKDKAQVATILKKRKAINQFDEFKVLCDSVKGLLNQQSPIINGLIFKSYSGKDINIGWEGYREDLDEALANDYIDEDLDVRWADTKEMRTLSEALDKVEKFIGSDLKSDFFDDYDEAFKSPMDMKNKSFWEEVFEADIKFR